MLFCGVYLLSPIFKFYICPVDSIPVLCRDARLVSDGGVFEYEMLNMRRLKNQILFHRGTHLEERYVIM